MQIKEGITDPCKSSFIPPQTNLLKWQTELVRANLAKGNYIVEFQLGGLQRYDIESIKACIKLHVAREIKQAVTRELNWFSSSLLLPKSVHEQLPVPEINAFKSMIHNHEYLTKLNNLDMLPDELARVAGTRFLSDDLMLWACKN